MLSGMREMLDYVPVKKIQGCGGLLGDPKSLGPFFGYLRIRDDISVSIEAEYGMLYNDAYLEVTIKDERFIESVFKMWKTGKITLRGPIRYPTEIVEQIGVAEEQYSFTWMGNRGRRLAYKQEWAYTARRYST